MNNMKRMRKCNDEIYQLAKNQVLKLALWLTVVLFFQWDSEKK